MSVDSYKLPRITPITTDDILGIKKQNRRRKIVKKPIKSSKKGFTLTQPTRRLIINEVGRCENCNDRKRDLEIHHIKKISDGGGHTPNNLIVLCHECHKNKAHRGSLSATEQRKKIRKRSVKLQNGIKVILDKAKKRQKGTKKGTGKTSKDKEKRVTVTDKWGKRRTVPIGKTKVITNILGRKERVLKNERII